MEGLNNVIIEFETVLLKPRFIVSGLSSKIFLIQEHSTIFLIVLHYLFFCYQGPSGYKKIIFYLIIY